MSSETLAFMNSYHSENEFLKYRDELANWHEHIVERTDKSMREFRINSESESDYNYAAETVNKMNNFDKKKLNVYQSDFKIMEGDSHSILTPPEDMLHNRFNKFSRYGYLDPTHELVTGNREYLFFSKPDLHLVDTSSNEKMYDVLKSVPFFDEAFNRYKLSYYSLQQTFNGTSGSIDPDGLHIDLSNKYINLLSNMVTSSFDLADISASDVLNNQNLYQTNTSYREGSLTSDLQYDFSLEFKDTKYLDVYMLFKIYDEYFRQMYMREILPTRFDYIVNKIYPEALSIWKVIVDDTGRIIYWAKATGCTPMSVPRGTISNIEGNVKFTINWKAQFIKDMDPVNLTELNYLTARSLGLHTVGSGITQAVLNNSVIMPNYTREEHHNYSTWVGYPLVINAGSSRRTGHNSDSEESAFHRLVWVNKK